MKKSITTILKIVISIAALWFVLTKVEVEDIINVYQKANLFWVIIAFLCYLVSRVMGAYRLNYFLRAANVQLSEINNLKLYLLGMYYSLFLPGSIGGDGYKVYWLKKRYDVPVKQIVTALLFDRIMGMMIIVVLLTFFYLLLGLPFGWLGVLGSSVGVGIAYWIVKNWFPPFLKAFVPTAFLSVTFHLIQILCIWSLLYALGVTTSFFAYSFIFLIASIAAAIPFTVGGAGARELTFLYGATYFGLVEPISVGVSFMFYLFSLIVALTGSYYSFVNTAISQPILEK